MNHREVLSVFPSPLARPALGISTEFAAPAKIKDLRGFRLLETARESASRSRSERFSLQRTAQVVNGQLAQALNVDGIRLISDRVTYCCSHAEGSAVVKRYDSGDRKGRALFGGLHVCGNQWLCPVCSQLISEFRGDEVRQAISWARKNNLVVELHTVTIAHGVEDELKTLLSGLSEAWRFFTGHKSFRNWKRLCGVVGYVRAFEVTHGQNGWHPHFHIMFFSESSMMAYRLKLSELWQKAVVSKGLPEPSIFRGYDLRDGSAAGEYLTKFGDDTKLEDDRPERVLTSRGDLVTWDAVDELSKWHSKKGKNGSLTPFDFLRKLRFSYATRQTDFVGYYKRLWKEYALATRGKSRLQWARGFKKVVGVDQVDDDEVMEALEDRAREIVAVIPEYYWPLIFQRGQYDHRSRILDVAEEMGAVGVAWWLWSEFKARGEPQGSWESFLQYMFAEIQAYQDDIDCALRVHWQAVMPVNIETVKQNDQLRHEMNSPMRNIRKR